MDEKAINFTKKLLEGIDKQRQINNDNLWRIIYKFILLIIPLPILIIAISYIPISPIIRIVLQLFFTFIFNGFIHYSLLQGISRRSDYRSKDSFTESTASR